MKRQRERAAADRVAGDANCAVVEMREAPDAELRDQEGQRIGLEIVSVVDQEVLESRRRLTETTSALDAIRERRGIQCYITIGFELSQFGLSEDYRSHSKWLKDLKVMDLVAQKPSGELEASVLCREGVDRIAWLSWKPSDTPGVGWGYRKRTQAGQTLVEHCLAKKHAKLAFYRERNGDLFKSYWLAIDSLGPGTVEDGGFMMLLNGTFDTSFDKVFLLVRGVNGGFSEAKDVTPPNVISTASSP